MKKLFLCAAIAVFSVSAMQAQTFKIGGTVGLPVADASDLSTFVLGIDAYYYFTDIDAFIEIGATAGFRNFFGKDFEFFGETISVDDAQFLPIAAAGRVKIFGLLSGGLDIGYAVGINSGNDGGFYFRPVVGFDIADTIELNASYESISNNGVTLGNLNIGVLIEI